MRLALWPLALGAMHGIDLPSGLGRGPVGLGRLPLRDVTRWLGVRLFDTTTEVQQIFSLGTTLRDLDEFQRFHDLLHGDSEAADLARQLFDFTDAQGNTTRTLLLSATPYRMLTLRGDEAEAGDHHADFLEVLEFLFGKDQGRTCRDEIAAEMRRYRAAMQRLPGSFAQARDLKQGIETGLRRVIARTERVAETEARDAMVREVVHEIDLSPQDPMEARAIAEVARAAGAPGTVEYWKSAPYLLSFMRGYKLADAIHDRLAAPDRALREAMRAAARFQLDRDHIDSYAPLAVPNGRMRRLMDLARQDGLNRRLWMPPALPYFGPVVPASKILVFSEWSMVPDAIAALLSYEAERDMGMGDGGRGYFDHARPRPLQFRVAQGRLAGLRALQLVIPSPGLAALIDPLKLHRSARPADAAAMRQAAIALLQDNRSRLPEIGKEQADWAAAAAMDRQSDRFVAWLSGPDLRQIGDEEAWAPHVAALAEALSAPQSGDSDATPVAHLAEVALGSPATCALRALSRLCPGLPLDDPALLSAAARIGMGFRSLFNQPEAQALLRAESEDFYWRAVLHHAAEHDLQSVLDEHAHVLLEAEGLVGHPPPVMLPRLAERIVEALTLRPAQIELNRYVVGRRRIDNPGLKMRGRFAMRLTGKGEAEDGIQRTGIVRTAFNSPFRPFVLATTSVGQEGLDFHPYCHRLVHWNLPHNPVDLEQREGRVHRYKNHAVRLNLAARFADAVEAGPQDPWARMFARAHALASRPGDLEPFWLLDGPHRIERHVLSLPFSREETRLGWLKRSVALYRLAFGQPRQDDLLAFLDRLAGTIPAPELAQLQIDLRPTAIPAEGCADPGAGPC